MTNNSGVPAAERSAFLAALQAGETHEAMRIARQLLAEDSSLRQISFIAQALKKTPRGRSGLASLKVGLLSSFSIEFIRDSLLVKAFLSGIEVDVYVAAFGQIQQEIHDPGSGLYAFSPDVVILAVEGPDWAPGIYRDYLDGLSGGLEAEVARIGDEAKNLIRSFRERSNATLLINNLVPPVWRQLGILDGQVGPGQDQLVYQLNRSLNSLSRENPGVLIVDYAGLVSRHGALRWYDPRMEQYAKAPIALEMLPHLAAEYTKFFRGITGKAKKCLVVDLDNTLWGGVLGEEGLAGIQLGPVYPGSAYVAFQREILNLRKRGILLAVASKNNPGDVDEVFANHPQMLLKKEHFSSLQINWKPKSESLEEIARQLNIGLDHIVLVDDNPAECAQVASRLPMVAAINLPKQPEQFLRALLEEGLFDSITYSAEDSRRGELYRQRGQAEALRESSASLDDFYRSLEMVVGFAAVDGISLPRSAQLTQKTNQFNVTTLRFSESTIMERMRNQNWILATVGVRDRFGDHGIVGLMMAEFRSNALEIETLLLSCRVIGRKVETAMLAYLAEHAVRRGVGTLAGRIVPTAKNMPVRELFEQHGFSKAEQLESGESWWTLDLSANAIHWPEWMQVTSDAQAACAT